MSVYYDRHGVTVHAGNCIEVLADLPAASVDAVITDPPYGLSEVGSEKLTTALTAWVNGDRERVPSGKGFMGKEWDAFVPPPAVWDECLRVLKPGGHVLVFAGSRTVDLMGLSIRLAGFEIRDTLQWLYGCLTDDTEVLTADGWRPGIEVVEGEQVAQWDPVTGTISLAAVQETFRGPWDGPMRVLRNADTDQVLTPNHRVYHRPWWRRQVDGMRRGEYGAWEVREAAEVSTWQRTQLPVAGEHDGPGIGGVDYAALLGWVWTEGGFDHSGTGVRIYQSSVNATKVAEIDALLDRLGAHKRYDRERTYRDRSYVETMWFISGELAERVRADLPGKRPTYDLLWRMTGIEKRALRDAALLGDGHVDQRGTWQFYQRHEDDLVWFSTLLALVGQAGKVGMRPAPRSGGAVYVRDRATTELQARHLRDDHEHYQGDVWCVRVPTGAFVARRNGRVFVTGNSGFPKSLDVGKAIDARGARDADSVALLKAELRRIFDGAGMTLGELNEQCGFEASGYLRTSSTWATLFPSPEKWRRMREVIGGDDQLGEKFRAAEREVIGSARWSNSAAHFVPGEDHAQRVTLNVTAPATDAARAWQGWGTALKPAHEPIICARKPLSPPTDQATTSGAAPAEYRPAHEPILLARKPLSGTVAATVLAHGTGAINIDGCRVATDDDLGGGAYAANPSDRHDGAENWRYKRGAAGEYVAPSGRFPANVILSHSETCTDDVCDEGCPVAELDAQSGITKDGVAVHRNRPGGTYQAPSAFGTYGNDARADIGYSGSGGASRFFPTFRWEAKAPTSERPQVDGVSHPTTKPVALMRWLVRLLTPPGGLVLDPFAGSGTTGQAARAEGKHAVLIERHEPYLPLIKARLDARDRTSAAATGEAPAADDEPMDLLDLLNGEVS